MITDTKPWLAGGQFSPQGQYVSVLSAFWGVPFRDPQIKRKISIPQHTSVFVRLFSQREKNNRSLLAHWSRVETADAVHSSTFGTRNQAG